MIYSFLAVASRSRLGEVSRRVVHGFCFLALTGGVVATAATPAIAQSASAGVAVMNFDVPAGPLGPAIVRFGRQSGLQLTVDSALTNGKRTPGIKGRYAPDDGLRALLSGSGLTFRFTGPRTVVLEVLPDTSGARVLAPLRVEGQGQASTLNGVNGSSDRTSTEGSGSYTSGALTVATNKIASIRDTPQSVSVVTREQMNDQNLNDLNDVLSESAGITTQRGTSLYTYFYSRGFLIDSVQIDGGSPVSLSKDGGFYDPLIDMAQYDHVEILRGADGLFSGYGSPGGSVNLVRKRPLSAPQFLMEVQAGSWNNFRTVIDATSPITADGKLRARVVATYQQHDYFYDLANNQKNVLYAIAEYDATPSTMVSAGISISRQHALPWVSGLPRYIDGGDIHLPRSTSFAAAWSRYDFDSTEFFGQVESAFNEHWSAKFSTTTSTQETDRKTGFTQNPVSRLTGEGMVFTGTMYSTKSVQNRADLIVNGAFQAFGKQQEIVIGANWQEVDGGGFNSYRPLVSPGIPVHMSSFNPRDPRYREPAATEASAYFPTIGQKQWGVYGTIKLTPWDNFHLISGVRFSKYNYEQVNNYLCTSLHVQDGVNGCTEVGQTRSINTSKYRTSDSTWPPNISAIYDLNEKVSAYASYTSIYEPQSNYLGADRSPLAPVTGENVELGIKVESNEGRLNTTVSAYQIEQTGYAAFREGPYEDLGNNVSCCWRRGNSINLSRGLDLEVVGEVAQGLQLSASYTFNKNEVTGSDTYAPRLGKPFVSIVPKHMAKVWANYGFQDGHRLEKLSVGAGVRAQTKNYTGGSVCTTEYETIFYPGGEYQNCPAPADYEFTQGGYAIFSMRAAYQVNDRWNAALNIENLFDRTYYETAGTSSMGNWYGEPRSITLSVRGKF